MERFIDPTASVGDGTTVGRFTVIESSAVVGAGCVIGHNVVIHAGTVVGDNVRIDDGAVLGKLPMKAANSATTGDEGLLPASIGDGCIIGTSVVIYAGCELGSRVLVADLASVREDVTVGDFTIVGRGVTVENHCTIGRYCKLESECYVTAYSSLADRVFVAPGVVTSNDNFIGRTEERFKHFKGVTVERGGRIAAGAVILPGKTVGADAVVAAGAVLTNDAPAKKIVLGSPARLKKDVPEEQLLDNQGWED
ncbi:N-acetyltransferase [bacterium]|nr:N-acetyltransferase [bacterium]